MTTSGGIPAVDAGGGGNPVKPDSGGGGTDGGGGGVDSGPPDTTAPLAIADLAATALGHTAIGLAWTAPADPPGGNVSSYEVRRSTANITNTTEFAAATPVTIGSPKAQGTAEALTVTGLTPETTYYFAIRAKDAAGNTGPISNVASASTKARATLLLSELAMENATGKDFIELVVTKAGNVKDLVVRQSQSPNGIHTFADLDVALNDRIVVHLTNLPGPTGFAQEDATKSKTASTETTTGAASATAWDVYSTGDGLSASDNLVSVVDGMTIMDAVAYSNRDEDAAATSMTAFATAKTAAAWSFTADPVDATNDCATQREAVAISKTFGGSDNGACGQFSTGIKDAFSINRNGTTDTNGKKDWYVAAQTPGAANSAIPTPTILRAIAQSLTTVDIRFDQEIDATTVAMNVFTGSGVTISAAALQEPAIVRLTTSTQSGPHAIGIDAALKTVHGASVPNSVRFCVYEPLGGMVALVEIGPEISGADLVELQATRAGNVGRLSIRRDPTGNLDIDDGTTIAGFPSGFCVALNDMIVVHLQPAALPAMADETLAKDQVPAATEPTYYDGAWDLRGSGTGLPNADAVIAIRDTTTANAGNYVDAMVYSSADGTGTASFLASLPFIQGKGLWLPADCGGATCTDASTPTAQGVAVPTAGVGMTSTSNSVRRTAPGSSRTAASWSVGAHSWGAANP